jgi:hypothetical protein
MTTEFTTTTLALELASRYGVSIVPRRKYFFLFKTRCVDSFMYNAEGHY